jgi:hypothetical protein
MNAMIVKSLVIGLLLCCANLSFAQNEPSVRTPGKLDAKAIMDGVVYKLSDPDSAKFREIKVNYSDLTVCGYVNSKNQLGGYAGFEPFIGELIKDPKHPKDVSFALIGVGSSNVEAQVTQNMCRQHGLM